MSSSKQVKIAIIGGSGLNRPEIIENSQDIDVETPYGEPSDALISGQISGVDCVLLCRHGRHHTISPTNVNYRANIWALKAFGCTHVIATTACGSLQEHIQPGDMVFLDQFIDRTTKRHSTFYDGSEASPVQGISHIPMHTPFCGHTAKILIESAKGLGLRHHSDGTNVTIEGPRFSSKAESKLFRSWGADVVNMTTIPEVVLAKEVGLCYSPVCLVTDYDCWRDSGETVSKDVAMEAMQQNFGKVVSLLRDALPKIVKHNFDAVLDDNETVAKSSVIIPPKSKHN